MSEALDYWAWRAEVPFHKEREIGILLYLEAQSCRNLAAESVSFRPINLPGQERSRGHDVRIAKTSQSEVQVFQNFFYV